jgi:hypothetical protein
MKSFLDLDHQFEDNPTLRRSHLRDLLMLSRPQMFLVQQPPGGGTSPTSHLRPQAESPTLVAQGAATAAPSGSAAAGGAAGIGNLLPWLYPTADFLNLDKFGSIALPATNGIFNTILQFTVPPGRNGKITQLGIDISSTLVGDAPFIQAIVPPQVTFSISTDQKGYRFQDYEAFNFAPGAVSAPTPINGLMIKENQTIYVKIANLTLVVGAQFVAARVLGYLYAKNLEPKVLGYQ